MQLYEPRAMTEPKTYLYFIHCCHKASLWNCHLAIFLDFSLFCPLAVSYSIFNAFALSWPTSYQIINVFQISSIWLTLRGLKTDLIGYFAFHHFLSMIVKSYFFSTDDFPSISLRFSTYAYSLIAWGVYHKRFLSCLFWSSTTLTLGISIGRMTRCCCRHSRCYCWVISKAWTWSQKR